MALPLGRLALTVLVCGAQSFEVASVKRSDPKVSPARPAAGDPRRIFNLKTSLLGIVADAYGMKGFQITGPSWLDEEPYDIIAKAPDNAPVADIPLMMQALLAERFKLKAHRETKDLSVYALTVGKSGPKMRHASPDGNTGIEFGAGPGIVVEKIGMARWAQVLSMYMDRPVVDLTDLQGDYAFELSVDVHALVQMKSGGSPNVSSVDRPPSIFTAVEQLGLKLEFRKVPMEMLVIDTVEKTPTEN